MEERVPARLSPREGRRFGLSVGVAFGAIAAIAGWRGQAGAATVLASIAAALILAALLVPGRLGPVQRAWMRFALAIPKVTTPVIMSIVYFLVITPTGALLRLVRGNPLAPKRDPRTFWVMRNRDPSSRGDMRRQF